MSKLIHITPDVIEKAKADFAAYLASAKLANGRIEYNRSLRSTDAKATVLFSKEAWIKMCLFVATQDKECAWHGIIDRYGNPEDNVYRVSDILVYPQTVTGSTVKSKNGEYSKWLDGLDDDTFSRKEFHAHSHVNFAASPSGTDLEDQKTILSQLMKDQFAVFMIINKKMETWFGIYDLQKNIMFENEDVSCVIEGVDHDTFVMESDKMVEVSYTQGNKNSGYNSPHWSWHGDSHGKYAYGEWDDDDIDGYDDYGAVDKTEKSSKKSEKNYAPVNKYVR